MECYATHLGLLGEESEIVEIYSSLFPLPPLSSPDLANKMFELSHPSSKKEGVEYYMKGHESMLYEAIWVIVGPFFIFAAVKM